MSESGWSKDLGLGASRHILDLVVFVGELKLGRDVFELLLLLLRNVSLCATPPLACLLDSTYTFPLQLFLKCKLSLVQPAELVDLVLIFSPDLNFVSSRLVLLRDLRWIVSKFSNQSII